MSGFYRFCMRSAAAILFATSLLILVAYVGYTFFAYFEGTRSIASGEMTMSPPPSVIQLLSAIFSGLGSAAWPFFGAALIWRIDRWLPFKEADDR